MAQGMRASGGPFPKTRRRATRIIEARDLPITVYTGAFPQKFLQAPRGRVLRALVPKPSGCCSPAAGCSTKAGMTLGCGGRPTGRDSQPLGWDLTVVRPQPDDAESQSTNRPQRQQHQRASDDRLYVPVAAHVNQRDSGLRSPGALVDCHPAAPAEPAHAVVRVAIPVGRL